MKNGSLIVITGACGMIGSGVVRHLNDMGKTNLLLVDDLQKDDRWKNLVGKSFADLIYKDDLLPFLEKRGDEVEAIIHLGACSDTVESDANYLLQNNYRYTIDLAQWALAKNKRFIYASSAATYGDGSEGFSDDENDLERLKPLNMYGFSKHLVDLWMKRQNVFDRVVALKYFNVFGPNENHKGRMASMVFKMMQKCPDGSTVHLFKSSDPKFADGGQVRDFIYVKDAVRFTCAFLEPEFSSIGGIFNVGSGKETTWNRLADAFFQSIEKKRNIAYIEMPKDLIRQYQNYTKANMSKMEKILSSRPEFLQTHSVEEGVKDYVQNYLSQDKRW